MINVNELYEKLLSVTQKDGQMGVVSNYSYNQYVNIAQSALFDYYVNKMDRDTIARSALDPFSLTTSFQALVAGELDRPSAARNIIAVDGKYVIGQEPFILQCNRLRSDEVATVLSSATRKPSIFRHAAYFEESAGKIKVYPETGFAGVSVRYLKEPVKAVRAVTQNVVLLTEEYDAGNSVQLEWNKGQEDVLLRVLQYIVDNELTGITSSDLAQVLDTKALSGKNE